MEKSGQLVVANLGSMKRKPVSKIIVKEDVDKWFSQDFGYLFNGNKSLDLEDLLKK